MIKQGLLEPTLTELANLQISLDKQGGPTWNGELYEQILEIQDAILKSFGLPFSLNYEKLIRFQTSPPTATELEDRLSRLHSAATRYLLSNVKSDLQILHEAQENQGGPMYVLPELKIKIHAYTIFVFNKILLKRKDSVENVLSDLRFCNQSEILNALGQIHFGTTDHPNETVEFLENAGVKYLEQFIIHNSNLLNDDDY